MRLGITLALTAILVAAGTWSVPRYLHLMKTCAAAGGYMVQSPSGFGLNGIGWVCVINKGLIK